MANHKSALKRAGQNERRRLRNKAVQTRVKNVVKDVRQAVETARQRQQVENRQTLLFVDEVHRFNKAQQDAFLPFVEDGTLTFIGATTENPSFEVNAALLSRARVYVLRALDEEALSQVVDRGLAALDAFAHTNALFLVN